MNKRDALKLRYRARIVYGRSSHIEKTRGNWTYASVEHVTQNAGVFVRDKSSNGNHCWTPEHCIPCQWILHEISDEEFWNETMRDDLP
jgi:hypothetical protein